MVVKRAARKLSVFLFFSFLFFKKLQEIEVEKWETKVERSGCRNDGNGLVKCRKFLHECNKVKRICKSTFNFYLSSFDWLFFFFRCPHLSIGWRLSTICRKSTTNTILLERGCSIFIAGPYGYPFTQFEIK